MNAVGECSAPCPLEPHYTDDELRINIIYPRVRKGRGCFGGEGEARLLIRGQKRLQLRLLCTLIPLVALAMIELGVPMPAELLDDWFTDIENPPADEAAA